MSILPMRFKKVISAIKKCELNWIHVEKKSTSQWKHASYKRETLPFELWICPGSCLMDACGFYSIVELNANWCHANNPKRMFWVCMFLCLCFSFNFIGLSVYAKEFTSLRCKPQWCSRMLKNASVSVRSVVV